MSVSKTKYDDEIDLLSLIQTIWDGKWKIAFIVAVFLLLALGFNNLKTDTIFTATTDIKPISSSEFDKYLLFNSFFKIIKKEEKEDQEDKEDKKDKEDKEDKEDKVFEITPKLLLSLYVEEIEEGSLLETGIDKYNLINKDDFYSEDDYKDAIEKFASQIKILKPIKDKNNTRLHHVLIAEYDDKDKWKDLLTFVNDEANRKVKAGIINYFKTIVSIQNQKKVFAINDLELKIDNAKKDYDRNIKDKVNFLYEQAAIARKLNIEKNTNNLTLNKLNILDNYVTSIQTNFPFYLRGYLAIEEEIKITTNRKNKDSFINNLYQLEQQIRDLEQDKTITRAEDLFNKTPLNQNNFQAMIIKVATTDYKTNNKTRLYYALAIFLGGMIGVVYVLISNAFRNRKNETVSF